MTDTAKLRKALERIEKHHDQKADWVVLKDFVERLLESSDIILIRKVDGNWPEEATERFATVYVHYQFGDEISVMDEDRGLARGVLDALSESLKGDG